MSWQLIESDDALAEVLQAANKVAAVAIDTEFMRRNTFYPQVALLQLCFSDTAWLIDPLAIKELGPLADFISNPGVVKILHSCSEDLEVFQQWLGVLPQPLFDTQRAAALVGRGFGLGYRALVSDMCTVELDKGDQRSDWLQRPLTQSQCEYAAQDVSYLLSLWPRLRDEAEAQGKTEWVFADGRDAANTLASTAGDTFRRIKLAWKLDARQLSALMAICDWREHTARSRDKPRSWIIDDKACFELAQSLPQSWEAVKESLPAPAARRYGDALLSLLRHQASLPESALPKTLPPPLSAQQRNQLKKTKQAAREIAQGLGVAPEVLLPSKDYELLVRESEGLEIRTPAHWSGWRADQVITPLRERLRESSP